MADQTISMVFRIFVQHWAADMPIRTFLALKPTCRAIADTCRVMEPACHWQHFEKYMADVPIWSEIREVVLSSPDVSISYNDEYPFGNVMINGYTWKKNVGRESDVSRFNTGIMRRLILTNRHMNGMELSRKGLRFRNHPYANAICAVDSPTDAEINEFIANVLKYAEHIENVYINLTHEDVKPPYLAVKTIIRYGIVSNFDIIAVDLPYMASLN